MNRPLQIQMLEAARMVNRLEIEAAETLMDDDRAPDEYRKQAGFWHALRCMDGLAFDKRLALLQNEELVEYYNNTTKAE
jgi:hypothetical protein